jgi:hypothetical protein
MDLEVPFPIDADGGGILLEELDYARHPALHEGRAPRYGALVSLGERPVWDKLTAPTKIESCGAELGLLRRLADGRASFVVRRLDRPNGLVSFDQSLEYESSAVRLRQETGAFVIQRNATGLVRVAGPEGVVTWDGTHWSVKPLAENRAAAIRRLVPQAPPDVLAGLLELCVHWLSAGRVGATLVLALDGDPRELEHVDLSSAISVPPLYVTRRQDLPPLLSVLSQVDRAALVDPDGRVTTVGVGLRSSDHSATLVDSTGGTRHTSARRFSFDETAVVVFVVSADGPVSVFSDGAAAAKVRTDLCHSGFPAAAPASMVNLEGETTVHCGRCLRPLLVDEVRFAGWRGRPERLSCPVCDAAVVIDVYRAAIRGVRKLI